MRHPFVRHRLCCGSGHWCRPGAACLIRGRRCRLPERASSLIFAEPLPSSRMRASTRWLTQRKSCLSVGTAFDPLHFIHEPLNHAIAKGSCCIHWQQPLHRQPTPQQKRSARQSHWPGQRLSIALSALAPRAFASRRPKSRASVNTTAMVESLWTRRSR